MNNAAFFSTDFASARERFRAAADRSGAVLESHPIAASGPRGEALGIDVATLGPSRARSVLIVSSGLHGVEGFAGSAVQLAWLERLRSAEDLPSGVKIVLVHALNPFGFAWLRRWNENNVDLNRNFLTDRAFLSSAAYRASAEAYARHFAFLNPARPPSRWEPYALKAVGRILAAGQASRARLPAGQSPSPLALAALARRGLAELRNTLLVGQYEHPKALFYGGDRPQPTTAWLQQRLPAWVAGAQLTLHIDIHSGYGKRGECALIIVDPRESPRARWVIDAFGDAVQPWDDATLYKAHGMMAGYFRALGVGGAYHGLTAEFGTYSGVRVLGALRAENQAHFYADARSPNYRWAKRQIVETFAPAAADWRATVIDKALAIIARALLVCSRG